MRPITEIRANGRQYQNGLAIVEFAIVLPLLLLMMLATAEFGRALYQYNTLSKAVRDGARYYVLSDSPEITKVGSLVEFGNESGSGSPLLPGTFKKVDVDLSGGYVTVTATYEFAFIPGNPLAGIMGLFGGSPGDSLELISSVTMRAS